MFIVFLVAMYAILEVKNLCCGGEKNGKCICAN